MPEWDYVWELVLFRLLEQGRPELSDVERTKYHRLAGDFAEDRASARATWPTCTWTADGRPATARCMTFAGRWIAYTADVPQVYLSATGVAIVSDGLRFAVTDGSDYSLEKCPPASDRPDGGEQLDRCFVPIDRQVLHAGNLRPAYDRHRVGFVVNKQESLSTEPNSILTGA
ncbi:MAG TPA: hypothetical protein VHW74_12995 [Mycobacteriales bacterium]|nr:hypothetical protein [Mycobacteriales bacterium]